MNCEICNEELFLDFKGENYICINGCQKIPVETFKNNESYKTNKLK